MTQASAKHATNIVHDSIDKYRHITIETSRWYFCEVGRTAEPLQDVSALKRSVLKQLIKPYKEIFGGRQIVSLGANVGCQGLQ
jgi:hypothetical protein